METEDISENAARVVLDRQELLILANALNLVCSGIQMPEFQTVIGADRSDALKLWEKVGDTFEAVAAATQV